MKSVTALINQYALEPKAKEIIVEGSSDARVYKWWLERGGIEVSTITLIESIEAPVVPICHPIGSGNRGRVIRLGEHLRTQGYIHSARLIHDADFDICFRDHEFDEPIIRTDFTSVECYSLHIENIQKFFDISICEGVNAEQIVGIISPVLSEMFAMRYCLEEFGLGLRPPDLFRSISGEYPQWRFDGENYINKYIGQAEREMRQVLRDRMLEFYHALLPVQFDDIRAACHHMDYLTLLFKIAKSLRNVREISSPEIMLSCLMQGMDFSEVEKTPLYGKLLSWHVS